MKTITKISLALYLCAIISLPACTQKPLSKIEQLNQVRAAKDRPMMMSSMRGEGCSVSDYIYVVASKKGTDKDGQPCLLVKHPAATSWTALEGEIKYFMYEEGYEYKIMCKQTQYDNNSKPTEYELTGVDAKVKKQSDLRTEDQKGTFENTSWKITHFQGEVIKDGYLGVRNGDISMSLGCNGLGGATIKVNEKNKTIKFLMNESRMTTKACSDMKLMTQEDKLFEVLAKIDNYESTDKTLILKSGTTVLMQLERG